jgi:hypothetical protein
MAFKHGSNYRVLDAQNLCGARIGVAVVCYIEIHDGRLLDMTCVIQMLYSPTDESGPGCQGRMKGIKHGQISNRV